MTGFFHTSIEFLKGVGPQRAALLNKELKIFTYADLIQHYPFRYEDRTKFYFIRDLHEEMSFVQIKGRILRKELVGVGSKKRLVGYFSDGSSEIELVWFQGINWVNEKVKVGQEFIAVGKPVKYGTRFNIAHPGMEPLSSVNENGVGIYPVYSVTDKLRSKYLDSRTLTKLISDVLTISRDKFRETLPAEIIQNFSLLNKHAAIVNIHFPENYEMLAKAQQRLKFEELFYIQLRLLKLKILRQDKFKGQIFSDTTLLTTFYNNYLPFSLTEAQKRVIKEIYSDLKSGKQMNRLLQGDVGSGKTIVGFICALLVVGSKAQCTLMAPTEILAQQHYNNLQKYAEKMQISIALLTGSVKKSQRKEIHAKLQSGDLNILIGTHALLEEEVQFHNVGLAIIDEQHRFGVAQRSRLWEKNAGTRPHVLVMTATPIPRTLAMTLYGDLDISVIDQLPAGRKPIKTIHKFDAHRLEVNNFLRGHMKEGRQVYVVYPLIEESEKLDLKDLMDGYESVSRAFPDVAVSIVHGKMRSDAKDFEMKRFIKKETSIMVATTVIEVGVDVPNASVMVIENAERFGLSQLHQLRGRVGRGANQSYCILMTSYKLSAEAKVRVDTMVSTNNGFEIAETDLKLRGPGDLMGTQQSGVLDLLIADLGKDGLILQQARECAQQILEEDPGLDLSKNRVIKVQVESMSANALNWSRIS